MLQIQEQHTLKWFCGYRKNSWRNIERSLAKSRPICSRYSGTLFLECEVALYLKRNENGLSFFHKMALLKRTLLTNSPPTNRVKLFL
jgi:hypothetical protein